MKPAELDLEHRRPVWSAISDLFLDTELQPDQIGAIVNVLTRSPYSLEELDTIFEREVYPACEINARHPAGEWVAFDMDWLEPRVLSSLRRPSKWPLCLQFTWWILRRPWRSLREQVARKRGVLLHAAEK